jgi:hypothetical protein
MPRAVTTVSAAIVFNIVLSFGFPSRPTPTFGAQVDSTGWALPLSCARHTNLYAGEGDGGVSAMPLEGSQVHVTHRRLTMITRTKLTILTAVLSAVLASTASGAFADTFWDKHHPRRDEIVDRLHNQDVRIDLKVAAGFMSPDKARRLHEEDHRIFFEEQTMAANDGGHLTKPDQFVLNQQLDVVSHQIGD